MPLSIWLGLEDCLQAITECWPGSVLDAGIGFGLFGHLLRQYLDVWEGRIQHAEWRIRIDGIEIDARRIQPHAHYLYDNVFVGDIRELVSVHASQTPYDVILFGDVLEHLPKDDAVWLLRKSIALAMKQVIVRIPLGDYALVAINASATRRLSLEEMDRSLVRIEERVRRLVQQRGEP
jgi:predicted TPR repeat methyltransferase